MNPVQACEGLLCPSLMPWSGEGFCISLHNPEPTGVSRRVGAGFALGLGCVANVEQLWKQLWHCSNTKNQRQKKHSTQHLAEVEEKTRACYSTSFCKVLFKLGFLPR